MIVSPLHIAYNPLYPNNLENNIHFQIYVNVGLYGSNNASECAFKGYHGTLYTL